MVITLTRVSNKIITAWSVCSSGAPITIWPDGCRDLIVAIKPKLPPAFFLTGLDATAYRLDAPANTRFFGVRLVPGTVAVWEEGPPVACYDLGLLQQSGSFSTALTSKILNAPDRASTLLLEAAETWFSPVESGTEDFFRAMNHSDGQIPPLSCSKRTQRRHLVMSTGAPPRFWFGLQRVRQSARDIVCSRSSIAQIAHAAGYADQAHLTREMRRWLGLTPAALRREAKAYHHLVHIPNAFNFTLRNTA